MKRTTLQITEGAMILAIMGSFFLLDRQLAGFFSSLFTFIIPLPLAIYTCKHQEKAGLLVLISAFILNIILVSPVFLFIVMAEELIGFYYGYLAVRNYSFVKILWRLIIFSVVIQLIDFYLSIHLFGINIDDDMANLAQLLQQLGQHVSHLLIKNIIYISSMVLGILQALSTCLLSQIILERIHLKRKMAKMVINYEVNYQTAYLASAGFFLFIYLLFYPLTNDIIQIIGLAIGLLAVLYLIFAGLVTCYFWVKKVISTKIVILLILVGLTIFLPYIIAILGMISVFYPQIRG